MLTRFFLLCYQNLGTILAVLSIMTTIIMSGTSFKKRKTKIYLVTGIILLALFTTCGSIDAHNFSTIVPNIIGLTYDDAMQMLYSNRLNGQLVLASTNENLADTDSCVVWQSADDDTIIDNGAKVSFVIDDCFALNSTPLNQYRYRNLDLEQSEVLDYSCDYHDVLEQFSRSGSDYTLNDPHWDITIKAADIEYRFNTAIGMSKSGRLKINGEAVYSYETYAKSMSATLERIIEDSAKFYSPGLQLDLKNCTIIGKIIPADGQKGTVLRDIEFECILRRRADTGAFASGHSAELTDTCQSTDFRFIITL